MPPDWPELFLTIHINYHYSFLRRLWVGIKYIFGFGDGAFDEVMLHHERVTQLRDLCNAWLEKHPWPYGEEAPAEDQLKWAEKMVEFGENWLAGRKRSLEKAKALVESQSEGK